jgi:DNA-binding transcriptional ArsR family regulator
MSNYDIVPSLTQVLTIDEQIRAYVHPTRMTILALLAQEKQSVSGIARHLGVHPANLTHHFKLLEKVGLIKLVEKRETGKNLEKYYRALAHHFTVSTAGESISNKQILALSILRDNLTAALQMLQSQADERAILGLLKTARLEPEDVPTFEKKLFELLDEFSNHHSETGTAYSLNISLYPAEAETSSTQEIIIRGDE